MTRGTWCTPRWLAELIGPVDLDPCSNDRAHIRAGHRLCLEDGANGLLDGASGRFRCPDGRILRAGVSWRTFINPPYGHGQVIRWVQHYRHTRFVFLLRWDPSTDWFSEILQACSHVWFPSRRINFEPPPGVHSSSNAYPHALYLRDPPEDLLSRLARNGYLFPVDGAGVVVLSRYHENPTGGLGAGTSGTSNQVAGGAGRRGGRAGARRKRQAGNEIPPWAALRFLRSSSPEGASGTGSTSSDVRGG